MAATGPCLRIFVACWPQAFAWNPSCQALLSGYQRLQAQTDPPYAQANEHVILTGQADGSVKLFVATSAPSVCA